MSSVVPDATVRRVLALLAHELRAAGMPAADLRLASPPQVTGRSTVYFVGEGSDQRRFVVKVPVLGRTPVDTEPVLTGVEQYRALVRVHEWFATEDAHSVSRPVAWIEELDAVAMEYVSGLPVSRAIARAPVAPATARRAVAAAGDALRRLHHHAGEADGEVDLGELVDDVLGIEKTTLGTVGLRLPDTVRDALDAVPRTGVPVRRVLLHGDFVPSNLVLTGSHEVGMIDPVLARVGLPEDDVTRFLAILSSESLVTVGSALPPVRRLRRDLENTFLSAYGGTTGGPVRELRLIRQHVLRWRRRRENSRLTAHPHLMSARAAVVDPHMRRLLGEAAERLTGWTGAHGG